jgi:6-pyruvoyltetrahydropterin/6-carboxytetrahydropterin synthase
MFSVGVSDHCMVAHSFADPSFGPAQRLHGATYAVEVEVRAAALGTHHVVMDIGALRALVRQVLAGIDYTNLDDHAAFPGRTSTSERLAKFVADQLADAIAELPADARPIQPSVLRIRMRESPNAWAGYECPLP